MSKLSIRPLGNNQTVLTVGLNEIFFSYQTPVAGFVSGEGYFATSEKFSKTTTRHINSYLDGAEAKEMEQSQIETLLDKPESLNTVNVVEYSVDNGVVGVSAFEESKQGNKEAAECFKDKVIKIGAKAKDVPVLLDRGYYEDNSGNYFYIVHSS